MITHATCLLEQLRGIKRRSSRVQPHVQSATIQASGGAEPLKSTEILISSRGSRRQERNEIQKLG